MDSAWKAYGHESVTESVGSDYFLLIHQLVPGLKGRKKKIRLEFSEQPKDVTWQKDRGSHLH
jgi:hypothetical protein